MPGKRTKRGASPGRTASENLRFRLPDARKAHGYTSQALFAEALTEFGYPMHETTIARIESGERKVTLDDAVVFAAVLGCQLAHLVAPNDAGDEVVLTPKLKFTPTIIRDWVRGKRALFLDDDRFYFAGALVPDEEIAEALRTPRGEFGRTRSDVLNPEPESREQVEL